VTGAYGEVVASHLPHQGVTTSRMFGTDCLKISGKVFAMHFKGALVVKLPAARVAELTALGAAIFDPGHGRPMKEWVSISPALPSDWLDLTIEARNYVSASTRR